MQENVHKQKKEPLAQPTTPQDLSQSQDPIGQYMQPPWLGGIQGGKGWRMDGLAHKNSSGPWGAAGRWSFPPTFRAIDSLRPTDRRRSVRRRPQRHPGNFPPLGLGRGVEGSRFRGGAQRPLGTAREQSPNAGAEKRRQNTLPALMRNPVHKNNNGKNNTQRQGFKNQKVMPDIMDRPMASVSVGLWSLCWTPSVR